MLVWPRALLLICFKKICLPFLTCPLSLSFSPARPLDRRIAFCLVTITDVGPVPLRSRNPCFRAKLSWHLRCPLSISRAQPRTQGWEGGIGWLPILEGQGLSRALWFASTKSSKKKAIITSTWYDSIWFFRKFQLHSTAMLWMAPVYRVLCKALCEWGPKKSIGGYPQSE